MNVKMKWILKISLFHEWDEPKWKKSGEKTTTNGIFGHSNELKNEIKISKSSRASSKLDGIFQPTDGAKECAHFPHGRLYNFVAFRRNKMQQICFAPCNSHSSSIFCQGYWNKWSAKLESDRFFLSLWDCAHGLGKARNKTKTVASTQIFFFFSFFSLMRHPLKRLIEFLVQSVRYLLN